MSDVSLRTRSLDPPEARSHRVQDLMERLKRGDIRIPAFQRKIKWDVHDVRKFFDSIVRGYPVGTLLFWRRPAPSADLRYGSLAIQAPSASEALWVVDGQQRLHALARVLLGAGAPEEPFALYFDLEGESFVLPRGDGVKDLWLPLNEVLDEDRLQEWIFNNHGSLKPDLRQRAFRLGRLLRQFEIPSYAVRTADEGAVREIFDRINNAGKRMQRSEVFDAIHGALGEERPSRMSDIAEGLIDAGFGAPDEETLYKMLLAVLGLDVGRSKIPQMEPAEARQAYHDLGAAARAAVRFLREQAGIPHISLLPYTKPLLVLARFFHHYPDPSARDAELLSRWVWRGALTGQHSGEIITTRAALDAIAESGSLSVQRLLALLDRDPPVIDISEFSFRTARGKLLALVLLELGPLHLSSGEVLRVDHRVYPDLLQTLFSQAPEPHGHGLANRLFHPEIDRLLAVLVDTGGASVLASHGISRAAQQCLRAGDRAGFLSARAATLEDAAKDLFARRARWDEPVHPHVSQLVVPEDD